MNGFGFTRAHFCFFVTAERNADAQGVIHSTLQMVVDDLKEHLATSRLLKKP